MQPDRTPLSRRFAGADLEALARESDIPMIADLAEELVNTQEELIDARLLLVETQRHRDQFATDLLDARDQVEQLEARFGCLLAFARPVDIQAAERHIAEHGLVDAEGSRRAV